MKLRTLSVSVALLFFPLSIHAQEQDEQPLRELSAAYARAWNKQKTAEVGGLHATDAILTTPDGETVRGREAIQKSLGEEIGRKEKLGISADEYRWLGNDAAVWRYEWKMTGGAGATSRGTGVAVLTRTPEGWLIVEDLMALTPTSSAPAADASHPDDGDHGHPHEGDDSHGHAHGEGDPAHDH